MPDFDPTEWITTNEAADLTGYSPEYIRRLLRNGRFLALKFGRDWLLKRADVLEYKHRMEAMGSDKYNPWREDLEDQGRGRKPDNESGAQ